MGLYLKWNERFRYSDAVPNQQLNRSPGWAPVFFLGRGRWKLVYRPSLRALAGLDVDVVGPVITCN